jgi:hypothetical protein
MASCARCTWIARMPSRSARTSQSCAIWLNTLIEIRRCDSRRSPTTSAPQADWRPAGMNRGRRLAHHRPPRRSASDGSHGTDTMSGTSSRRPYHRAFGVCFKTSTGGARRSARGDRTAQDRTEGRVRYARRMARIFARHGGHLEMVRGGTPLRLKACSRDSLHRWTFPSSPRKSRAAHLPAKAFGSVCGDGRRPPALRPSAR